MRRLLGSSLTILLACTKTEETPPDAGSLLDSGVPVIAPDAGFASDVGGMCVDTVVFADNDGDGFGVQSETASQCLVAGQSAPGFARQAGDCKANDAIGFPGSEGVCGDFVDDDCSGSDKPCPTTQTASLDSPNWDCTGTAPNNVYAFARFVSGEGHYQDGGCFIFFEGLKDEFYAKHTLRPSNQNPSCFGQYAGCICPSSPSYDKRIMAYTLHGSVESCPETAIVDHGGISSREAFDQPTSNDCRKYLYAMHFFDIPASFVAGSVDHLERRITAFPTVEIACAANPPNRSLTFASLLNAPIERNPGFVKK
ncbi:MAG: hypothetical protein HY791_26650 [Deltaproteobacteria bacterium]|nr:hypothetical protein [Deltaproteobacteria bacterium]